MQNVFKLLIPMVFLFSGFACGQCYQAGITANVTDVCSGGGVTLTCSLIETAGDESKLTAVAWQATTTPANPGSWVTQSGTGKTFAVASLTQSTSYRVQYRYDLCSAQTSGYITVNVSAPSVAGVIQGDADVCASGNSGNITLSGQTGAVKQWYKRDATDLDWTPVATTAPATFTYNNLLITTRYRAEVQSGVCPSAFTGEVEIGVHPTPSAGFTASRTCDGSVTRFSNQSTVSAGYIKSYQWQFGDGSQSTQQNPTKQYYNVDSYQAILTAVSDMNCPHSITQTVIVHPNPVSGFQATENCVGTPTLFTNSSSVRSGEGLNYRWSFGDEQTDALPSPEHLYAAAGTFRVKLVATTVNGLCRDSVERDVTVYAPPAATAGNDTTISAGHGAQLQANGGVSYVWSPYEGLSSSIIAEPIANPMQSTLYTVTVTDANGCINTAQINVFVSNDFKIRPYNVITPDGNGENDTWTVDFIENYPNAKVRIINRFGEEVYYSDHYSNANGWKGMNKNGDILPEATYYYIITLDGEPKIYKGFITLLRK